MTNDAGQGNDARRDPAGADQDGPARDAATQPEETAGRPAWPPQDDEPPTEPLDTTPPPVTAPPVTTPPGAAPPGATAPGTEPPGTAPPFATAGPPPWTEPPATPLGAFTARYGLVRPAAGRQLAGVCAAVGRATNTDPVLWRVLFAVLTLFGGIGLLAYLVGWLVIPAEGDTAAPVEALAGRGRSGTSPVTVVLVGLLAVVVLAFIASDGFRVAVLAAAVLLGGALLLNRGARAPAGPYRPEGHAHYPGAPGFGPTAYGPPTFDAPASGPATFTTPASGPPAFTAPTSGPGAFGGPGPGAPAWGAAAFGGPAGPGAAGGDPGSEPMPYPPGAYRDPPGGYRAPGPAAPVPPGTAATSPPPAAAAPYPPAPGAPPPGVPPYAAPPQAGAGLPGGSPVPPPVPPGGYRPPFAPRGPYAAGGAYPPGPPPPGPVVPGPPRRPRPPREPSRLVRVVLSLACVALGVLAAADLTGARVRPSAYFATGLGIIGLGLLAGAWVGRARWLIPVGLATTVALGISSGVEGFDHVRPSVGDTEWRPRTFEQLDSRYELGTGDATLDLRELDFTGRNETVVATVRFGSLRVILPPDVDVDVRADINAGDARVFGVTWGGINQAARELSDDGADGPGGGQLRLTVHVNAGDLEVDR
ncbi:MAG TPA: PspC domain-containing protein [Micromonosporaceae bacterium]|nr:PspC domain-containing protein [Micromonosporaceae bacterium]